MQFTHQSNINSAGSAVITYACDTYAHVPLLATLGTWDGSKEGKAKGESCTEAERQGKATAMVWSVPLYFYILELIEVIKAYNRIQNRTAEVEEN